MSGGDIVKKENVWQIISLVLVIIIIGLSVYTFVYKDNKKVENNENSIDTTTPGPGDLEYRRIRIDEDLSVDGKVENLENVRWHNARIMQNDEKIEVSIMLNNESKDKKIEAKTLTVRLLNKEGKEIASKDVKMNEISDNYGYTDIKAEFENMEYAVIYNIELIAK